MRRSKMITRSVVRMAAMVLAAAVLASAQLPTAKSLVAEMGMGWNIGNTMEVPNDPTGWGNPLPTQTLIDSVKAAGFKTIRIPCAWRSHTEADSVTIKPAWLAQVKTVVDYAIKDSLFVMLNIHWDEGWLENKIDSAAAVDSIKQRIIKRQGAYWRQIANYFKSYDHHLLFAGTNEPNVKTATSQAVLKEFLQIFIDTVRATGGNNASRTLIIQGPSTDIEKTNQLMTTLPTDQIAGRLMAEVHFYPYQFSLMEDSADWGYTAYPFYYWGRNNHSTTDTKHNPNWGEESFVDSVFNLMKVQFVDKDIPVVLGEFGAIKRLTLSGDTLNRHIQSRRSFYEYVASSAKAHGIIPVPWDAGGKGTNTMTVFDRATGGVYDLGLLNALRSGWGLSKIDGDTSYMPVVKYSSAMRVLYSVKDSLGGQVDLGVVKPDFTAYDSILVRTFVKGTTEYDSSKVHKYGYMSLSLVTMSNGWKWKERGFGALVFDAWKTYAIPLSSNPSDTNALAPSDPTKVDFFALQAYSKAFQGAVYIDWIVFKKKNGASDTLYSFDLEAPSKFEKNVDEVKLVPTSSVAADLEWQTATTSMWTVSVGPRVAAAVGAIRAVAVDGGVRATWTTPEAGVAQVVLNDPRGRVLWTNSVTTIAGANLVTIPVHSSGVSLLRIRQGDRVVVGAVLGD